MSPSWHQTVSRMVQLSFLWRYFPVLIWNGKNDSCRPAVSTGLHDRLLQLGLFVKVVRFDSLLNECPHALVASDQLCRTACDVD